jgi:DNA-binding MarR family transcriptional regulator
MSQSRDSPKSAPESTAKLSFRERASYADMTALSGGVLKGEPMPVSKPRRPGREKVFGDGYTQPLDGNAKVRIWHLGKALTRKTEKGKHYGAITAKALDVLHALLWKFHNGRSGLCFPSYERIAAAADCARSTVGEHIKALEEAGLLTWVNRIVRIRDRERDLFGHWVNRWRVIRTSNAYRFRDFGAGLIKGLASKSEFRSGTMIQELSLSAEPPAPHPLDPTDPLDQALLSLGTTLGAVMT